VITRWRNLMRMREEAPFLALYSPGGRVTSRFKERVLVVYVYESSTLYMVCIASYPSTSPPWSLRLTPTGTVPHKLGSPRAHRAVGPGTHRGSGPREVHTTVTTRIPKVPLGGVYPCFM
jgi:hypothetical protein